MHKGKAKGFANTVTEDLQNLLDKNSSYTSRWSGTADRKARSLSSSQAMVWRNDGCVNSIISLRHLNRRLRLRKQGQALGFCKASKRIDTCRTCHTWDTTQAREIARSVTELREMLLDLFPDYFAAFNAGTLFMWSTAVDMGVESVLYLESLAEFISQHKQVQKFSRRHLDEEKSCAGDCRSHGVGKIEGRGRHHQHRVLVRFTLAATRFRQRLVVAGASSADAEAHILLV